MKKAAISRSTCLTIDGAQGNEYQIVIITLVRCNSTGQLGFLDDFRRLNVGITRAKAGLIIIGSYRTLLTRDSNSVWTPFLKFCADNHLLQNCKESTFNVAAGAWKAAKPEASKKHAKPSGFGDVINVEQ